MIICQLYQKRGLKYKKWGFVGWIANLCTLLVNMYYVVVGGWILKYAVQFMISGGFGDDVTVYYNNFISKPVEPLIWAGMFPCMDSSTGSIV